MFNFHKPRVYRSVDGCCICRAKSSSSRFTTSRKYEKESMQCFNLIEPRIGEICNACVLLVKRYKRLPAGSKRHWGHVVDARAGPGTKSLAKQKKRENEIEAKANGGGSFIPEKFAKIFKKNRKGGKTASDAKTAAATATHSNRPNSTSPTTEQASDSNESYDDERADTPPSCSVNPGHVLPAIPYQTRKRTAAAALAASGNGAAAAGDSRVPRVKVNGSKRRRLLPPVKNRRADDNVPFFEEHDLVRLEVCCGIVFQSLSLGSHCYIIDPELYRPCEKHLRLRQQLVHAKEAAAVKPAVPQPSSSHNSTCPAVVTNVTVAQTGSNTPALKKHHLYFKRQSESFPQGDINRISPVPLNKTEAGLLPLSPPAAVATVTVATSKYMVEHSARVLSPNKLPMTTHPATAATLLLNNLKPNNNHHKQPDSAGNATATGSATATAASVTTTAVGAASPSSLSSSSNCSTSSSVATKFNDNSSDSGFDEHVLERKSVSPPSQDDLQLERKVRKLVSGGGGVGSGGVAVAGMQRLILASGLPISGQSQNLLLAANEFTARLVHQRQGATTTAAAAAAASGTTATTTTTVLGAAAQNNTNANTTAMRAIYNNANSIQHENGVTTILPASSLAATNQTAAMNAISPNTVTITPAPIAVATAAATVDTNLAQQQLKQNAAKIILIKPSVSKFMGSLASNNNNNNNTNTNNFVIHNSCSNLITQEKIM